MSSIRDASGNIESITTSSRGCIRKYAAVYVRVLVGGGGGLVRILFVMRALPQVVG